MAAVLLGATGGALAAPAVADFGPVDTQREARQVRLRFSEDMVALGDTRAADPATVACSDPDLHAAGRWIDARNWVGEFPWALPDGLRCSVKPAGALRSLAGAAVAMPRAWEFNTGGPKAQLFPWRSPGRSGVVREGPLTVFLPSAPVDPASLRHLACEVDGTAAPVRILAGGERDSAIELLTLLGTQRSHAASWIAARCGNKPWPSGASIRWTWSKQIASRAGVTSQSDTQHNLHVRERFGLGYQCQQLNDSKGCDPRRPISLVFTEAVARGKVDQMVMRGSSGKDYALETEACFESHKHCSRFRLGGMPQEGETLRPVFPAGFADVDSRPLEQESELNIFIARLPVYLGMPQARGALGWKPGSSALWPLAVRNTEAAIAVRATLADSAPRSIPALLALHRLSQYGSLHIDEQAMLAEPFAFTSAMFKHLSTPPVQTRNLEVRTSAAAMEFVGIPLSGYGSWLVEADSPRFRALLEQWPGMSKAEPRQYIDPAAYFRPNPGTETGRVALVQLTNLSIHTRVANARDALVWVTAADTGKPVAGASVEIWSCRDERLTESLSDADGRVLLANMPSVTDCGKRPELWVVARKGDDIAVLRFHGGENEKAKVLGHTIVDRVLVHPIETVSMQHIARLPTAEGWASARQFYGKLAIYHGHSELVHEQALEFDADGAAVSSWPVPAGARLGKYRVVLRDALGVDIGNTEFQVEDFRRPLFDAQWSGSAEWQGSQPAVRLAAGLRFMAGGAAAGQPIVITGRYFAGVESPVPYYGFNDVELPRFVAPEFVQRRAELDELGQHRSTVLIAGLDRPSILNTEMQFTDPNGEVRIRQATVNVWPQRHKLGLRVGPAEEPGFASVESLLLDERDAPLAGREVVVDALAVPDNQGGRAAGEERMTVCTARTDAQGRASCNVPWSRKSPQPYWLFRARTQGASQASQFLYKSGLDSPRPKELLVQVARTAAQAGKPVLLRLRAPFVPATVLLTVEREGVMASHVLPITASEQEFALPTERAFAPGVRVQAHFVNGASAKSGSIDLRFDQATHRLAVEVSTPRDTARPGQSVPATIKVLRADGKPAAGARVTVAAYDDALESLRPNLSWWVANTFWQLRWHRMESHDLSPGWTGRLGLQPDYLSSFEQRVSNTIGRAWAGEFGGDQVIVTGQRAHPGSALQLSRNLSPETVAPAPRSDFSSLALWKTDVLLDERGVARVSIPLKDSLTRWRIVAVAMEGSDQYGYGHAMIQATKPIQVLSGLPQVVRAGDRLVQAVTVRNDSAAAVTLEVKAESVQAGGQSLQRKITLAARSNQVVEFALAVPDGVPQLDWRIEARQADGEGDALHVTQRVLDPMPVTVRDSTIVQVEGGKSVSVARPAGALAGKGGVGIEWKASLADAALLGARAWMRAYPYGCLEQISSKAAVSGDPLQWRSAMDKLSASLDDQGLAQYFPVTPGSEVLTAYLLDLANTYGLEIPASSRARMEAALQTVLAQNRHADWVPEHSRLAHRLALQAAIAPNLGAARPVIPDHLGRLPTIALMDWVRYLLATPASSQRAARLKAAAGALRGRYELQSTRLSWRGDHGMRSWWMMWTMDVASARMALLAQQWQAVDARWKKDAPRLALALVDKQHQGHWDTTASNAWAVAALQAFARNAESGAVTGSSRATLGAATNEQRWPDPEPVLLPWSSANKVELRHSGSGAPWALVSIRAAMKLDAPLAHGVEVSKTISPVEQRVPGKWSQGDVLKVTLALRSHGDNSWLVINDPIPSGASILGKGLGGESALALAAGRAAGDWWTSPSFEERGNDSYRAYYQRIGARAWSVSYLVRLNNPGSFQFPVTRVEAMYAPGIFAEAPNAPLEVDK